MKSLVSAIRLNRGLKFLVSLFGSSTPSLSMSVPDLMHSGSGVVVLLCDARQPLPVLSFTLMMAKAFVRRTGHHLVIGQLRRGISRSKGSIEGGREWWLVVGRLVYNRAVLFV